MFFPSGEYSGCHWPRVESINFVGEAPRSFDCVAAVLQMFEFTFMWTYARRFPWRETVGESESPPAEVTGWGSPPATGILHNANSPPRLDEKIISRPSEVHARPAMLQLSDVSRLGAPPETLIRKMSCERKPGPATYARVEPSGERAGFWMNLGG